MFLFDRKRSKTPDWFFSDEARRLQIQIVEYLMKGQMESAQTDVPLVWKFPVPDEVLSALLHASHGKCAFCETRDDKMQAYRFRPPANAEPFYEGDQRDSYLWLAWEWQNLYPICSSCRPSFRDANYFPLADEHDGGMRPRPSPGQISDWTDALYNDWEKASEPKGRGKPVYTGLPQIYLKPLLDDEKPALLSPDVSGFWWQYSHLTPDGEIVSNTRRANFTFHHFDLNRPDLCRDRLRHMEAYAHLLSAWSREDTDEMDNIMARFATTRDMPLSIDPLNIADKAHGDAWYLLLRSVAQAFEEKLGVKIGKSLSALRIAFKRYRRDPIVTEFSGLWPEFLGTPDSSRYATSSGLEKSGPASKPDIPYPPLTHILIENYKSLETISLSLEPPPESEKSIKDTGDIDRPDTPCLLLLGENATGKSTLLEAVTLAALSDEARTRLIDEVGIQSKHLVLNPMYMGSHEQGRREQASVTLDFSGERRGLRIFPGDEYYLDKDVGGAPLVFAYGAHRMFGGRGDSDRGDIQHVITLFKNDEMTIDAEDWLIGLNARDPESLNEVAAALRNVIQIDGAFRNIEIKEDEGGTPRCFINLKRDPLNTSSRRGGTESDETVIPMRLSIVSSGYRVIMALICDIFAGLMARTGLDARAARHVPTLILIDEIEAHLHPRWKLNIVTGLRRAFPGATFIFSSHDPLCVRGMLNGEVVVLNRFDNRKRLVDSSLNEVVEQVQDFPHNIEELTIEQLLTSDLFQMYSTDDRRLEREFAQVAELLRREADDAAALTPNETDLLKRFRQRINKSLPVGATEAERVVQEAVAEFLAQRREVDKDTREALRREAKQKILAKLQELF